MKKLLVYACLLSLLSPVRADTAASPPAAAPAPAADDLSQYKTSDDLWKHIGDQADNLKAGLQNRDLTVKDIIPQIWASIELFVQKYPTDTHIWDVKMLKAQIGPLAAHLEIPKAPTAQQTSQEFEDIATDDKAPKEVRATAASMEIDLAMQTVAQSQQGDTPAWDGIDAKIAAFQKEYAGITLGGQHAVVAMLRSEELGLLKQAGDAARFQSLLKTLSTDALPDVAAMANEQLTAQKQQADLKSKPLDLKYTAIDGTEVDLSKLRGKVVLIDFWATWCPPCREEVPNVVAAYQKYHDKGFEVVGVSLDQSKDALQIFIKGNQMVWPQYFDGKGWGNDISTRFGIDSIPAMWLVDKKGMVVTTDGEDDLAGQIEKLLAQ